MAQGYPTGAKIIRKPKLAKPAPAPAGPTQQVMQGQPSGDISLDIGGTLVPMQLESVTGAGPTFKRAPKPVDIDKEIEKEVKKTVKIGKAKQEITPLGERIGQANMEAVIAATNIPEQLEMAKNLVSQVPENVFMAKGLDIKEEMTPFITEDRQKLRSVMTLLNQNILKMFQGSRPTDRDFEILKAAINAAEKGRGPYMSALNVLEDMFNRNRENLAKALELGYEVDRNKLNEILNIKEKKKKQEAKQENKKVVDF